MDPRRKFWNEQQQSLRQALNHQDRHAQAVALFLSQHAMVHSTAMTQGAGEQPPEFSFEDEIWDGLSEEAFRRIPPKGEHSIAWAFWHLTRIEDMTMNVLAGGQAQLFHQDAWLERLHVPFCDTGNAMTPEQIVALSAAVDMAALREYRAAVGRQTRQVVRRLQPGDFKRRVDPARLQRLLEDGSVVPEAAGLLEYWGSLTITGLLLMPPTRHNFVHLNEARELKRKSIKK